VMWHFVCTCGSNSSLLTVNRSLCVSPIRMAHHIVHMLCVRSHVSLMIKVGSNHWWIVVQKSDCAEFRPHDLVVITEPYYLALFFTALHA
jgi:hypothetical protein